MSTVILDTITGKSTATTITIGSTPVVSASANSMTIRGEGSAQTSIQGGLSKAWIAADNSSGNISITDSLNFSSSLDVTAGKSTISFSSNMATAKGYSIAGANADASDQTAYQYQSQPLQDGSVATGSIALVHSYVTSNASGMGDYAYWSYSIHGDLA